MTDGSWTEALPKVSAVWTGLGLVGVGSTGVGVGVTVPPPPPPPPPQAVRAKAAEPARKPRRFWKAMLCLSPGLLLFEAGAAWEARRRRTNDIAGAGGPGFDMAREDRGHSATP